ncbi:MAG: hypothetical protein GY827_05265 [Cytophagales bacterium]|nr:hypothetical protein [Cytophagales bacterium]
MNFYQNEGYVTPAYHTDNPAESIAHFLAYMNAPNKHLIAHLERNGYQLNNLEDLRKAIIQYMSKSEQNVDHILSFHPHYEMLRNENQQEKDLYQVYYPKESPKFSSHFDVKFNALSVLVCLVIAYLVVKIVETFQK